MRTSKEEAKLTEIRIHSFELAYVVPKRHMLLCDLCQTKWHWHIFLFQRIGFPDRIIPPLLIHLATTLYNISNRQRR